MEKLPALIAELSDGRFHSGLELAIALEITRVRLRKLIRQLPRYGLRVVAQPGRGYCLNHALELLNRERIIALLTDEAKHLLSECMICPEVSSTNDVLLAPERLIPFSPGHIAICAAEFQSKGRGRIGKQWVAPYGSQICLSLLWPFVGDFHELAGLSLAVGVALRRALLRYGLPEALKVKWPNDLLFKGAKLAGILIESKQRDAGLDVVIGLGVNLSPIDYQAENYAIADVATILQQRPGRNQLVALLLNELLPALSLFADKGLSAFLDEWRQHDALLGREIEVVMGDASWRGCVAGLGDQGELLLQLPSGEVKPFLSGEISLRLGEEI